MSSVDISALGTCVYQSAVFLVYITMYCSSSSHDSATSTREAYFEIRFTHVPSEQGASSLLQVPRLIGELSGQRWAFQCCTLDDFLGDATADNSVELEQNSMRPTVKNSSHWSSADDYIVSICVSSVYFGAHFSNGPFSEISTTFLSWNHFCVALRARWGEGHSCSLFLLTYMQDMVLVCGYSDCINYLSR